MTTPSKAKGDAFERAVVAHLNEWEFAAHAERRKAGMTDDRGDIVGAWDLAVECKNYSDVARGLREGLDGLDEKRKHSKVRTAIAVVKRARKPADQAYAVMTLRDFCALYQRYQWAVDEAKSKDQALRGAITQLAIAQNERTGE